MFFLGRSLLLGLLVAGALHVVLVCSVIGSAPNNSFKPNLLRYSKSVAAKSCHAFASTTQVGLTQVLGAQVSSSL
jgi:hypothetical protein